MLIGVAATPEVAIPTLEWLLTSEHEIVLVISQPDRAAGRGREFKTTPVSTWAISHGLALIRPNSPQELQGQIDDLDCVLTIGYGVLLPEAILRLPKFGFLNLHFSLLPAYRGAAPVQRAIENGETETGVSVFALDKGMDTGPIYSRAYQKIEPQWRSFELMQALAKLGPSVVESALTAIQNGITPVPQSGASSLAPKISKAQAKIDWSLSAKEILARIRAFYPQPGAWSEFKAEGIKLTSARASEEKMSPGEIVVIGSEVNVGCAHSSAITLLRVIPAGRKEMSAAEWSRGARLEGGSHFD